MRDECARGRLSIQGAKGTMVAFPITPAPIVSCNYDLATIAYLLRYFIATAKSFGQGAVMVT